MWKRRGIVAFIERGVKKRGGNVLHCHDFEYSEKEIVFYFAIFVKKIITYFLILRLLNNIGKMCITLCLQIISIIL